MIILDTVYYLVIKMGEAKATTQPDYTGVSGKKFAKTAADQVTKEFSDEVLAGSLNDTTNVTIAAPNTAGSKDRTGVKELYVCNRDTIAHTISISLATAATGGTEKRIVNNIYLPVNATLRYDGSGWWSVDLISTASSLDNPTILSGSTNGKGIKVAATATLGTTIHTAIASTSGRDVVCLYAVNTSGSDVKLTVEWGQGTAPDGNIEMTVRAEDGLLPITPPEGLPINNSLVITAFAATGNVLVIYGNVTRVNA